MAAGNGVCNQIIGDNAVYLTSNAWGVFQDYASQSYELVSEQIEGLNNFQVDFHSWDASFNNDGTLSGFLRPTRPTLTPLTEINFDGQIPDVPTLVIPPVTLDTAPAEPSELANLPSLNLTVNGPDALDPDDRPDAVPDMNLPDAPAEPTLTVYTAPTLTELTIPEAPEVTIALFDELPPEFTAAPPSGVIDFTENAYVSDLLTGIKARITTMMAGEGLPPAIAAAIYGRGADREDVSDIKLTQSVYKEFASRGFEAEPNGLLASRVLEARQTNRTARAGVNRDVIIQEQQIAIENVRFAVSSGIQLEGQLIQAHMAIEQRRFELSVKLQELQMAVFNAYATAYNAQVQAFNARVEAYRAYVDSKRAEIEVFKAQVEAAIAQGQLNEQQVRVYEAQLRSEMTKVDTYRAQVEGYRARIEAERTRIEGYKAQVDGYRAFVEAYKAEWDAERTRVEAEVQRGRVYQTLAEIYATRVDVWSTKGKAKIEEHRENMQISQLLIQQNEAQVRVMLAKLEAAKANLQGQIATQDAQLKVYTTDASVESTAVDADTRAFSAITERSRVQVELALKDAELQISQIQQIANLMLRAMESAAQASSQLTASAMSAVNFSAGISSSLSHSDNCSTAFSFSGEISDAP